MSEPAGSALRVGLVLDPHAAPRWVRLAISAIQALPEARIVLLLQTDSKRDERHETAGGWGGLAYGVFRRLDRWHYGRRHGDSLEESELTPQQLGCPALTLRPGQIDPAGAGAIREHRLDVLIDFRPQGPPIGAAGIARLGVWSYRHGATPRLAARPPAFREVTEGKEPLFSALVADGGEGSSRLLYASWSPIHKHSVHRTLDQCLPKLAQFPARVLRGLGSVDRIEDGPARSREVVFNGPYRPAPPGNGEVVASVAKVARRFGRDLLGGRQSRVGWRLACAFGSEGLSPRPDRILEPAPGTFRADPFPVATDDGYWVFFEEVPQDSRVGYLSVMKMDRSGRCGASRIILQQPTHLSYPGVYRIGTEWFLLPESSATGVVQLYRATRFPCEWVPVERLLEGVRAYDPTLVEIAGRWWMFVNQPPEGGSSWDELHLYHAERPQGPWTPHPRNPVVSDARGARPAGHLFEHRGALYRPAQDCGIRYGRAIVVNRILKIDAREYEEVEAARILPDWDPRVLAVHTLNRAGDLTMLDCIYRSRRRESREDREPAEGAE